MNESTSHDNNPPAADGGTGIPDLPGHLLRLFDAHHAAWSQRTRFRQGLADIEQQITSGTTTQAAVVLAEEAGWKTALMGLAPQAEIPLHDHPGERGLLFVETGSVDVRWYDVALRPPRGRAVMVTRKGSGRLEAGDHDWIGRRCHNLHTLKAGNEGTLIFSVRQTGTPAREASLYAIIEAPVLAEAPLQPALVLPGNRKNLTAVLD